MNLFPTPEASHQHSLQTLELISAYDSFMDNLKVIADMGCGNGLDLMWWANCNYEDDLGRVQPRNYKCFGIDTDISRIHDKPANVRLLERDFETPTVTLGIDLLWSHDSFRYAINPLATLKLWNEQMTANGMIVLIVPQMVNIVYNKPVVRTFPGSYHNYNITNLMYMLAVNGFDCREGHFVKHPNDPWIHCVAYKSDHAPMDPRTTTWYHLSDKQLLPETADRCITKHGYLKQEDLQTHWLNGQFINWSKV